MGPAGPDSLPPTPLELLTWNIGYAGLGSDADFVADGGRHIRTRSRSTVERNLDAIIQRIRAENPDVVLLQELSRDSYVTHRVDVLAHVQKALEGHQLAFAPTISVTGLPFVGDLEVGQGTFAGRGISRAVRHALPSPALFLGMKIQNFHAVETRLRTAGQGGDWVIFRHAQCPRSTEVLCAGDNS